MPNVTISIPDDPDKYKEALAALPANIFYEAKINGVHLVETGPNGTCKKILQSLSI